MGEHPRSDFEKLSEYRSGLADEATRREVEAELARPGSPMKALLDHLDAATRQWLRMLPEPGPVADSNPGGRTPATADARTLPESPDPAEESAPDEQPGR